IDDKNHDVAGVFCCGGGACASIAANFLEMRQWFRVNVVSLHTVARLHQSSGNVASHNAQANESNGLLCHVVLASIKRKAVAAATISFASSLARRAFRWLADTRSLSSRRNSVRPAA